MRFLWGLFTIFCMLKIIFILFGNGNFILSLLGIIIWGLLMRWSYRKGRRHREQWRKARRDWRNDPNNWSV